MLVVDVDPAVVLVEDPPRLGGNGQRIGLPTAVEAVLIPAGEVFADAEAPLEVVVTSGNKPGPAPAKGFATLSLSDGREGRPRRGCSITHVRRIEPCRAKS